ncbi:TIGR02117 family protein [Myroides fluvii]|uniref:TIGR02117 family protein n=1 Tax=Myroides fluvii TaxID=2572594 RepID=UPI00131C24A8|nr:TIGR02117 family protein [Myroides fluvii]
MSKKAATFLARFFLCLFTLVIGYVGVFYALSFVSTPVEVRELSADEEPIIIYLSTNGVHTDFVVPVTTEVMDWKTKFTLPTSQVKWLAFGWGDQGFYLNTPNWSDLQMSTALAALSGRGASAMHVTAYPSFTVDSDAVELLLSPKEYRELVLYIDHTFQKNEGLYQRIETSAYGPYDAFYQAKGSYSLFYTCNTWVNQGLKRINQKAALWTLHDQGIFRHYK